MHHAIIHAVPWRIQSISLGILHGHLRCALRFTSNASGGSGGCCSKRRCRRLSKDQSVDGESFSVSKTAKINAVVEAGGFACKAGVDLGNSWILRTRSVVVSARCGIQDAVPKSIQDGWWCLTRRDPENIDSDQATERDYGPARQTT